MLGLLLRGAAAEDISCVETNSNCGTGSYPDYDYSACACYNTERTCADDGRGCTVTCSGFGACFGMKLRGPSDGPLALTCSGRDACRGMTVHAPPAPHKVTVDCGGGGGYTCSGMVVHAEAAAGLRFTCGGTGGPGGCGYGAKMFCPNCDQDAEGGCAAGSGSPAAGGGGGRGGAARGRTAACPRCPCAAWRGRT